MMDGCSHQLVYFILPYYLRSGNIRFLDHSNGIEAKSKLSAALERAKGKGCGFGSGTDHPIEHKKDSTHRLQLIDLPQPQPQPQSRATACHQPPALNSTTPSPSSPSPPRSSRTRLQGNGELASVTSRPRKLWSVCFLIASGPGMKTTSFGQLSPLTMTTTLLHNTVPAPHCAGL
ncbi:hypothetical protein DL95DRAFT_483782 [Leptodontidium sp. 2 PMI_412]|nr:hypothetical protein DL95DRAFT_483782 [Leptodontidium sp. 2 PMI_412]